MTDKKKTRIKQVIASIGIAGSIAVGASLISGCNGAEMAVEGEKVCLSNQQYSELRENLYSRAIDGDTFEYSELVLLSKIMDKDTKAMKGVTLQSVNSANVLDKIINKINR